MNLQRPDSTALGSGRGDTEYRLADGGAAAATAKNNNSVVEHSSGDSGIPQLMRTDRSQFLSSETTRNNRQHASSASPPPSRRSRGPLAALKGRVNAFWARNKGLVLVLASQFFGTLMNVTARLLEVEGVGGKGMHPFQILFARMSITCLLASTYMWYKKVEHFPFGMKEVRGLLLARGFGGFFGVFGMYYSLMYLPLADATVITFLAPGLACWACSFLINEPFTRMEQIATYISLVGVILIARPTSLFSGSSSPTPPASGTSDIDIAPLNATVASPPSEADMAAHSAYSSVTPSQRAGAVALAMLGVLGAATAFTTLRWIGKRAHPLISVNYFAAWCTIVSIVMMFAVPSVGFRLPGNLQEWGLLFSLGISGFIMQFLLASGLQQERSSRATNMAYSQMLFALAFDKIVFGSIPSPLSIIGSSLILGSAIYVALNKEQKVEPEKEIGSPDEERGLVGADQNEIALVDEEEDES